MTTIESRLQSVRRRIEAACEAAGRPAEQVALLAVAKTFGAQALRQAHAAGQRAFGENYVQEALGKMAQLTDLDIEWHYIGPLQSNKTGQVASSFDWVHSVDRLKIAQRLSQQRPAQSAPLQVCIQVNIDGGRNKSGVAPDEALALAQQLSVLAGIELRGLMAIPEPSAERAEQLTVHLRVAELFHRIGAALRPRPARWDTLSLGMSGDLEAAVLAGSTMVRVGTAVFGERVNPGA